MEIVAPESSTARTSTQEWAARFLILAILVGLRVIAFRAAGALWRDEVHSVDMATGTFDNWLYTLTNDSFPALWQVLLRGWISLFGASDSSIRWLGFLSGLTVIPVLWWATRPFGVAFPWWSMVLLGMDPSLIVFGGEARGYGLGVISLLVLFGVAGRVGLRPTLMGWGALILASLVAVHLSYTNCFMLAAVLTALSVGAARRGLFGNAVGFLSIGVFAASTMLPYVLYVMPRLGRVVHQSPTTFWMRLQVFMDAYEWGGAIRFLVWPLVGLTGLWAAAQKAFQPVNREAPDAEAERATFLLAFAVIGTLGFWAYVQVLGVSTQQWYYLPLLTVLAVTADLTCAMWAKQQPDYPTRTMRAATVVGLAIACQLCITSDGPLVAYRLTSIDLVAKILEDQVRPDDLVIVTPWYLGHSFHQYYHGRAEWIMLPNIDRRHFVAGYVEVHEKLLPLSTPESIKTELAKIRTTLQAGGRIWWVGSLPKLAPGQAPLILTAAPDPVYGWTERYYNESWWQLAIAEARTVGYQVRQIEVPKPPLVHPPEDPPLFLLEPTGGSAVGNVR